MPRPTARKPRRRRGAGDAGQEAGRLRGQQRRQHRQRADDGAQHDQDRADGEAREQAVAGSGTCRSSRRSRSGRRPSTARPEVAAAISIESTLSLPSGALAALAGEVEDRVVDADGEADQQDHGLRHVGDRQQAGWRGPSGRPPRPTALIASSSGMPASTSPPNATTRISRVSGSDSFSACAEVLALRVVVDLAYDASPASPIVKPDGPRRRPWWRRARARRGRSAVLCVPGTSKLISAERPSAEIVPLVVRRPQPVDVPCSVPRRRHHVVDDRAELRVGRLQRRRRRRSPAPSAACRSPRGRGSATRRRSPPRRTPTASARSCRRRRRSRSPRRRMRPSRRSPSRDCGRSRYR